MQYYLAPLEGITTYIYRNAFYNYYGGVDKYFTPFIAPNQNRCLSSKELKEISKKNNQGLKVVPQILTNKANEFIDTTKELQEYGYQEVNLNLGCPSPTVVTKGKGAGFLDNLSKLQRFLDEVFSQTASEIAIKTRIGISEEEEWEHLLDIYNQYPVKELIIHPRLQLDFYQKPIHIDCFEQALLKGTTKICFNGDICTIDDLERIRQKYPMIHSIMIGRGLIKKPYLLLEDKMEEKFEIHKFEAFHNKILNDYVEVMSGEKNTLFKLKELWNYWEQLFPENTKMVKKIRKSQTLRDYQRIVEELFRGEG